MATDVEGLYAAVKALVCVVRSNHASMWDMDRIRGYQVWLVNPQMNMFLIRYACFWSQIRWEWCFLFQIRGESQTGWEFPSFTFLLQKHFSVHIWTLALDLNLSSSSSLSSNVRVNQHCLWWLYPPQWNVSKMYYCPSPCRNHFSGDSVVSGVKSISYYSGKCLTEALSSLTPLPSLSHSLLPNPLLLPTYFLSHPHPPTLHSGPLSPSFCTTPLSPPLSLSNVYWDWKS